MLQANDLNTVYDFVKSTGEPNIRKMMTGPKMTNAHVGLLLKVVRSTKAEEFVKCAETESFPKIKFNDQETAIRDGFWKVAFETFVQLGLATVVKAA